MQLFARASALVLLVCAPLVVSAASLKLVPSLVHVKKGQTVSVLVQLDSSDQASNAVSGTLNFDPDSIAITAVKSPSLITLWTHEPTVSGSEISFEGIAMNPGFVGSYGTVATLVITGIQGTSTLAWSQTQVLANDGAGTDITGTPANGRVIVDPVTQAIKVNTVPQSVPRHGATAVATTKTQPTVEVMRASDSASPKNIVVVSTTTESAVTTSASPVHGVNPSQPPEGSEQHPISWPQRTFRLVLSLGLLGLALAGLRYSSLRLALLHGIVASGVLGVVRDSDGAHVMKDEEKSREKGPGDLHPSI